jgi:hypothetical protein
MDRFSAGNTNSGINTADRAYFSLQQTGTAHRLQVIQVMVTIAVAPTTAPAFYLVRTTARGTQTSTLVGQGHDPNAPTALGTVDQCSSGTPPTFTAANKIQVGALAITAGGVFIWTFYDKPLIITNVAGNGLAIANSNASGATTGTFFASYTWDE